MRITKTSDEASYLKNVGLIANIGCHKCPCCGEARDSIEYVLKGILNMGIARGLQKTWAEGFWGTRSMKCDCYSCRTCGAQWESEPYEW